MKIDYTKIPESTMETLSAYINYGRPVGGFCEAVLCNDLREAFGRADEWNRAAMFEIVCWLYNFAPCGCWGSKKNYEAWMKRKRAEVSANV